MKKRKKYFIKFITEEGKTKTYNFPTISAAREFGWKQWRLQRLISFTNKKGIHLKLKA